jgi:hypothetical protein
VTATHLDICLQGPVSLGHVGIYQVPSGLYRVTDILAPINRNFQRLGCNSTVEHLPSVCKALGVIPSTLKRKEKVFGQVYMVHSCSLCYLEAGGRSIESLQPA